MDRKTILLQIEKIFRDVLDDERITLTEDTTAKDIEKWDSLTHILIIVGMEKHFNIKFTSTEIIDWKNVKAMIDSIQSK
jgi:acyl carrier protein